MDLATLRIKIEGDSSSFDKTVDASKRKLQSFASEAGNKSKIKLTADDSGVTQGVNKAKSSVAQFARTKADVKLTANASGVSRGVANAQRSLKSLPSKVDVLVNVREQGASATANAVRQVTQETTQLDGKDPSVRVSESGASSTASSVRDVNTEVNQLNGQSATVNVRESGSASTVSSLRTVRTERDNLNGVGINIPWNSTAAESGAMRLGQGLRSLAIDIRAIISVGAVALFPGLIAALGTLPSLATAAAAGLGGLASVLGGALVGAATSAGSALGLLGGALGLLQAPIGFLGSKFKEYEQGLNASTGSTSAASSAASGYESALDSLSSAQQGVADAQAAAQEKVDGATQAYMDSLDQVAEAERAAEDARVQAAERSEAATQAYSDALQAVEDAEQTAQDARLQLNDATETLTQAQQELNIALRDEPLNQAEADLERREALLGQAEAADRLADAQTRLSEAKTGEESADAHLAIEQAMLGQERAAIRAERAQNAYYDTSTMGSEQLQGAYEGLDSAYESQQDAINGVADADKGLLRARTEAGRAFDDIAKAEAEGMRGIEDADRALLKAREESGRKYEDIAKAQADGQKGIEEALKRVDQAERQVADAALKMAEAQGGAKASTYALTAAQQALFDRWIAFKQEANEAFTPAQDSLAMLGVAAMDLASRYLPAVGQASFETAEALRSAFAEFDSILQNPTVDAGITFILEQIPIAAGLAGSAVANLGGALIVMFSRAVPYGTALLESFQGLTQSLYEWASSAEGIAQIDAYLAAVNETASRVGAVIADIAVGFYNLFQSINEAGITDQMLGGLENMAQYFRDITTEGTASRQAIDEFMAKASPILTALGSLAGTAVTEFFRLADVVASLPGSTEGLSLVEEILYAIEGVLPSLTDMFIGFVEGVGPLLVELLPKFGELFEIIGRNSGVIENILHLLTPLLDIFLAMPAPLQDFIVYFVAAEAAMSAMTGITLTGTLLGIAQKILLINYAAGKMASALQPAGTGLDDVGKKADGAKTKLGSFATFAGGLVIGAIALDILLNLPDMASAFSETYTAAREEGDGVGSAFMSAMSAAIGETTTGSLAFAVADAINAAAPEHSIWDVITGEATQDEAAASGNLIAKLANVISDATNWLLGYTPETSFMDVLSGTAEDSGEGPIGWLQTKMAEVETWLASWLPTVTIMDLLMGNATMGDAEGAGGLAGLLVQIQTGLAAVDEWLATWVPTVSIMDVLTGQSTMGEAAEAGNPLANLLVGLQTGVATIEEWMGSLTPSVSLMDVFTGKSTMGEAADAGNPLAEFLVMLQNGWAEVEAWWNSLDFGAMTTNMVNTMLTGLEPLIPGVTDAFQRMQDEGIAPIMAVITQFLFDTLTGWIEETFGVNLDAIQVRVTEWLTILRDEGFTAFFTEIGTWLYDTLASWIEETFGVNIDAIYTRVYDWLTILRDEGFIAFITEIGTWLYDTLVSWIEDTFGVNIDAIYTRVVDFLTTLRDDGFFAFIEEIATWLYDELNRWIEDVFGVSLDSIIDRAVEFGKGFYDALAEGIAGAVNAAIDLLNGLLTAIDTVLEAINVSPLGITVEHVTADTYGSAARHGLATTEMRSGGIEGVERNGAQRTRRGGKGTHTGRDQIIRWDEQTNGPEYWIASGDPNKQRQRALATQAAQSVGLATVPMRHGGAMYREMAVGGETDLGIEGLSGQAYEIASTIDSQFGTWANTYTNHGAPHYNTSDNTWDHWGGAGFVPIDVGTGDAVYSYLYDNHGSILDTVIWNGIGEGPGGVFEDYEHPDHVHASIGGSGISGTFGAIAGRLMQIAQGLWNDAMSALGMDEADIGEGGLWDGVEEYLKTLPSMAWNWILSKIPRGNGRFSAGSLTGEIPDMIRQAVEWAGWPADEADKLIELWGNESGLDPWIENYEGSGAYGIPQIMPSAHGYPVPLGDAAGQIKWGIDYITERYGSPSAALDFWNANNSYKKGGRIPGRGARGIMAHGGERVLTEDQNAMFERAMGMRGTGPLPRGGDRELNFNDARCRELREDRRALRAQNDELVAEMRDMKKVLARAMREPFDITDRAAEKMKGSGGVLLGGPGRPENVRSREQHRRMQAAVDAEDNFAGRRY